MGNERTCGISINLFLSIVCCVFPFQPDKAIFQFMPEINSSLGVIVNYIGKVFQVNRQPVTCRTARDKNHSLVCTFFAGGKVKKKGWTGKFILSDPIYEHPIFHMAQHDSIPLAREAHTRRIFSINTVRNLLKCTHCIATISILTKAML